MPEIGTLAETIPILTNLTLGCVSPALLLATGVTGTDEEMPNLRTTAPEMVRP
jgi:hypothetical protein